MPEVSKVYIVEIWEHDRFMGAKLDETKYFDNKPEAERFVKKYNAPNTSAIAPEWYMQATLING